MTTLAVDIPAALVGDVPVWVLEDGSGLAVIAAEDAEEMWAKVRAEAPHLEGDPPALVHAPSGDTAQIWKVDATQSSGEHEILYGPAQIEETAAGEIRSAGLVASV